MVKFITPDSTDLTGMGSKESSPVLIDPNQVLFVYRESHFNYTHIVVGANAKYHNVRVTEDNMFDVLVKLGIKKSAVTVFTDQYFCGIKLLDKDQVVLTNLVPYLQLQLNRGSILFTDVPTASSLMIYENIS